MSLLKESRGVLRGIASVRPGADYKYMPHFKEFSLAKKCRKPDICVGLKIQRTTQNLQ